MNTYVEHFHKKVMEDERINSLFGEIDTKRFLTAAFAPNISEIYKEKEPTVIQFNALIENLVATLKEQGIDLKDIDEVCKIALSFSSLIVVNEEAKAEIDDEKVKMGPKRYPIFSQNLLFKKPDYGALKRLEGTWVNFKQDHMTVFGLVTICVPSPGTNTETFPPVFNFECHNYTEKLTFKPYKHVIRNQGGFNEQLVGGMKYNSAVVNEHGLPIHNETGMYLWLGDMYANPATSASLRTDNGSAQMNVGEGGPNFVPFHTICRIGAIGHGNSLNLLGTALGPHVGKPNWPESFAACAETEHEHIAISKSMGWGQGNVSNIDLDKDQPRWVFDNLDDYPEAFVRRVFQHTLYPYSVRPDLRLRDSIKAQKIVNHCYMELSSDNTNGEGGFKGAISNQPFVAKFCNTKKMNMRLWIEQVEAESGEIIDQLQYEQVVFFEFMSNATGATVIWPHIMVNTLRRENEVNI